MSAESADGHPTADAEPPIGLSIDVVHEAGDWGAPETVNQLAHAAAAALSTELPLSGCEACIAFSSDEQVAHLNATYRGQPAPTNVLSFPTSSKAPTENADARFLGDVVLAAETVSREAKELGFPLASHLQHLIVHGLLHLLGYDHQTEEEAKTMEALEIRILARLGVGNPYGAAGEPFVSNRHVTDFDE